MNYEGAEIKEPKADMFFRLNIIFYELGDLSRDIVYMHRFPDERIAHKANARLSLADLFTQLSLLCKELDFNEEKLRKLGWRHLKEKYKEFEKRGWTPT